MVRFSDSSSLPAPTAGVGPLLREWRTARRLSQLDLAFDAEVSARHLSCVESGKSQPSRDLVARLADALEMPLRERNSLLVAAGYAPVYHETPLTTPAMAPIQRAIECILKQQEPYPALVLNRHWDLLLANDALTRLFRFLLGRPPLHTNIVKQIFDPEDMRPLLANWEEIASDVMRHLHNEAAAAPSDAIARELLTTALAYPGVPAGWKTRELGAAPSPVLTAIFRKDDLDLRFFSTFTTFGTSRDVTIDELRIECMFPMDEGTRDFCRTLAA